jgi:hypothetical protein
MNVYRLKKNNDNIFSLLIEMFDAANIDGRIDRDILAGRMLTDCGRREPRYNTTDTFLFFGSVWLKSKNANITKTLNLLELQYNPLNEYEETKTENIDREHTSNGSETKSRDVNTTDAFTSQNSETMTSEGQTSGEDTKTTTTTGTKTNNSTDEHFVSAENESAAQLRTRDTHTETNGDSTSISESGSNESASENSETTTGTKTNSDHEIIDEDVRTSRADTTTHDDTINTTTAGHKTAQAELIRAELEKAKLNIYDVLIDDFADIMFINVF